MITTIQKAPKKTTREFTGGEKPEYTQEQEDADMEKYYEEKSLRHDERREAIHEAQKEEENGR